MEDLLLDKSVIDSSKGIHLIEGGHEHNHGHEEASHEGHHHEEDPHIWLSPENAKVMAHNIYDGLRAQYPAYAETFNANLAALLADLDKLQAYGEEQLADLSCRELITFHDGFSYLAESFGLTVLEAVEEESGSEASAAQLIRLCGLVTEHHLPAVFTEVSGSASAASVISRETGAACYALDMAMAGDSYFDAMYRNIDTLREALQ